MDKKNLLKYKKKLLELSKEDEKQRNLYLRDIANNTVAGPATGYSSIDKPWLKFFDEKAIVTDIPDVNACDYLLDSAPNDVPLMEYNGKEFYIENIKNEIDKYINRFSEMGIKKGDTVSFIMLNVPEAFFMWVALTKMGAIANLIRPDEGPERIAYMNNIGESDYLFISDFSLIIDNVAQSLMEGNKVKKIIVIPANVSISNDVQEHDFNDERFVSYNEWLKQYEGDKYNTIYGGGDNVAVIVYTGGTTGAPKGVELTNKNIVTGAHNFRLGNYGFEKGKTSLNILPTGIAYGINATYNIMCCGVKVINLADFEIEKYPELVAKYKPNVVFSGPILYSLMVDKNVNDDLSFLEVPLSGGDKLHLSEEEKINEFFKNKNSDSTIHQGYGMSECTAGATVSKKGAYKEGSVGIPMANIEVAIFDYDDKETEKNYGEIGEICVSGPILMNNYRSNKKADDVLIRHHDGKLWLHTDDLGYMDEEGHLFHQGRAKRMLTRKGTKVWLGTLEDTIKRHPNVKECCCVKKDDTIDREVPVANIVLNDESLVEETCEELDEMIRNNQPLTYIPKYYVVRDNMPITSGNNKIDFKLLENENVTDDSMVSNGTRIYIRKTNKKSR